MQILEAMISLMVLISFLSFIAGEQHARAVEDSLYKYQLANDVWRVVYLRNGINAANAEADIEHIGKLTNLCIFIGGERVTNCRGEEVEELVSTERITIINGAPQKVMVTLAKKKH